MIHMTVHEIQTKGQGDAHDVTAVVEKALAQSALRAGTATISVIGSTAGVTTMEFESGAIADLNAAFERLAPRHGEYQHHLRWGDDNGSSHVRAALLGPSVSIPIADRKLALGTWQQIVVFEFDTGPRQRRIVIQFMGE
jgi:secondary thiamine-phosphate synthase enzyme